MPAARALYGTVPRREDHDLALRGRDRLAARLCARTLLDEEELAAVVVGAGPAQETRELEREDDVAVEVLVQAVVAAVLVVEEERCRLRLAVLATHGLQLGERRGMTSRRAESVLPRIGDGGERRKRMHAKGLDQRGQRRREVLIVADAEAKARHLDAGSEALAVRVHRDQFAALVGREHGRRPGVAMLPERLLDRAPIECGEAFLDIHDHGYTREAHPRNGTPQHGV